MRRAFTAILERGHLIKPGKGSAKELNGVLLDLSNPLARLSSTEMRGKIFSALGELCWYLAKSDDLSFMTYYISGYNKLVEVSQGKVFGAYGPRLFDRNGFDQMATAVQLLAAKPNSRRAVLVILEASDLSGEHSEVPCTCTLQMFVRDSALDFVAMMRSNDVYMGLLHDAFAFTMFQEIAARKLGIDVGSYKHFVGSLHMYESNFNDADRFLKEGWQAASQMPPMPKGDPCPSIELLLEAEAKLRLGETFNEERYAKLDAYWLDLIRLLRVFRYKKEGSIDGVKAVIRDITFDVYRPIVYGVLESMDEDAQNQRRAD